MNWRRTGGVCVGRLEGSGALVCFYSSTVDTAIQPWWFSIQRFPEQNC